MQVLAEDGVADYSLNAIHVEVRGIVCAPSTFIQHSSAGDGIEMDNLDPDGTVRVGNAGPSAQDQDQITPITPIDQGGSGGAALKKGEDSDEESTIDAQCRPIEDFVRLFTCGIYPSKKGQERGTHDATPKIVDIPEGSRISPTYHEPQEPPPPP